VSPPLEFFSARLQVIYGRAARKAEQGARANAHHSSFFGAYFPARISVLALGERGSSLTLGKEARMHSKLEDWKNGWFGVQLGLKKDEIDRVIALLQMLKDEPDQHFHLSSDYKESSGLGDIEVFVQPANQISNMESLGRAIAPGEHIDEK
jgi:hypothetical protein